MEQCLLALLEQGHCDRGVRLQCLIPDVPRMSSTGAYGQTSSSAPWFRGLEFAPVIGEILAQRATDGATAHDISRFRLDRFGCPFSVRAPFWNGQGTARRPQSPPICFTTGGAHGGFQAA